MQDLVQQVMNLYPRIYFACHTRHVRDARTEQVVSSHQASILDHLDEIEPTSLTTLASHMGVTLSTMSLTIDRLLVLIDDKFQLATRWGIRLCHVHALVCMRGPAQ